MFRIFRPDRFHIFPTSLSTGAGFIVVMSVSAGSVVIRLIRAGNLHHLLDHHMKEIAPDRSGSFVIHFLTHPPGCYEAAVLKDLQVVRHRRT